MRSRSMQTCIVSCASNRARSRADPLALLHRRGARKAVRDVYHATRGPVCSQLLPHAETYCEVTCKRRICLMSLFRLRLLAMSFRALSHWLAR
jgi:hypothetical protein